MKTIEINMNKFLYYIADAILMSATKVDAQIIFDGEDFHVEEVVCKDFIRGYFIEHIKNNNIPTNKQKGKLAEWMSEQVFIHHNLCIEYFHNVKNIEILTDE
jgi:hypothetical protein